MLRGSYGTYHNSNAIRKFIAEQNGNPVIPSVPQRDPAIFHDNLTTHQNAEAEKAMHQAGYFENGLHKHLHV